MARYSTIRVLSMLLVGGGLVALAACTDDVVLGGSSPECTTNADCAVDGAADTICIEGLCRVPAPDQDAAAIDPVWGCLGKVAPVAAEPSVPVTVPLRLYSMLPDRPRAGIEIVACASGDVLCEAPLPGSAVIANESGDVNVPVFSGFTGDFKVTGADLEPAFIAALPVPNKARAPSRVTWYLWDTGTFAAFVAALRAAPAKDDLAHVIFITNDCQQAPAADVTVTPDVRGPETNGFYLDANGAPNPSQSATAPSGVGGFINLTPGSNTFSVRRTSGETVGTHAIMLRPGATTYVVLPPGP